MLSFFENNKALNSLLVQMLLIICAFVLMGASSYFIVRNIENKHLTRDAQDALSILEAKTNTRLLEYETFLNTYAETINGMVLRGADYETISSYTTDILAFMMRNDDYTRDLVDIHGYFNMQGGVYISGENGIYPDIFNPRDMPWYNAAMEANGKIAVTEHFVDLLYTLNRGIIILSFSRQISDNNGGLLGVVCIDVDIFGIYTDAIATNLTKNSYGILLNGKFDVMAHPESYMMRQNLKNINSNFADLVPEMEKGIDIYGRKVKNYRWVNTFVYFNKIKYDWYLGIVIPVREYFRNMYIMLLLLFMIGTVLAAILCYMLNQIAKAKIKSDIKNRQKSSFLATMSHEIRTPLNAILGMTEIQLQNSAHPPSTSEAFLKINSSGNILLSIINDILDLSKIETGKFELVPVKYEVANLINDIVQLNYIRYESKPIDFNVEVDENTPSVLVGDELRIKQILNNLLSNAFKYTDEGTVTLSVSAEYLGRGGAVHVTLVFVIKDTGFGMSQEQVSKLFDENYNVDMESNRTTEGAGLGTIITRNLVNLMYGKINVKSAIGEGTSITVRLPQKTDGIGISGFIGKETAESLRQHRHSNIVQHKKSQITHEYMPYGRILIVDDVETNLYVAKGLMIPYGLKIDLAKSGFEAIDKIKEGNTYDIVFMDHMMPKLDGIETTKQLREMGYTKPVVALTANAITGQAEMFLKNGFDGFISKPIDIRQLNVALNRLIRDKQSSEVVEAAQREKANQDERSNSKKVQINRELAEIFARDAEKAAVILETCMQNNLKDENDLHLYIINVHAMKSALANIGESELSAVALRLEQAGREKDINVIQSETNDFLDELNNVISRLKPNSINTETNEDSEEALDSLREKLLIIKEACAVYDKKTIKNTLNELREKEWSFEIKDMLKTIAEYLLHSEFDNAAALADKFLKK